MISVSKLFQEQDEEQLVECPECGKLILHGVPECPKCGAKIDWEKEEEKPVEKKSEKDDTVQPASTVPSPPPSVPS